MNYRELYALSESEIHDTWKNNPKLILTAVFEKWNLALYLHSILHYNKEFVLAAVDKNPDLLEHVDEKFKDDAEIVLSATESCESAFTFASDRLKNDREFILSVMKRNALALEYVDEKFKNDLEVVMTGLSHSEGFTDGVFHHVSEDLKGNPDVAYKAVCMSYSSIYSVVSPAINSKEFLLKVIQIDSNEIYDEFKSRIANFKYWERWFIYFHGLHYETSSTGFFCVSVSTISEPYKNYYEVFRHGNSRHFHIDCGHHDVTIRYI